jgi:hypothetical protein
MMVKKAHSDIVFEIASRTIDEYKKTNTKFSKSAKKLYAAMKNGNLQDPDWVLKALRADFEEANIESS